MDQRRARHPKARVEQPSRPREVVERLDDVTSFCGDASREQLHPPVGRLPTTGRPGHARRASKCARRLPHPGPSDLRRGGPRPEAHRRRAARPLGQLARRQRFSLARISDVPMTGGPALGSRARRQRRPRPAAAGSGRLRAAAACTPHPARAPRRSPPSPPTSSPRPRGRARRRTPRAATRRRSASGRARAGAAAGARRAPPHSAITHRKPDDPGSAIDSRYRECASRTCSGSTLSRFHQNSKVPGPVPSADRSKASSEDCHRLSAVARRAGQALGRVGGLADELSLLNWSMPRSTTGASDAADDDGDHGTPRVRGARRSRAAVADRPR